MGNSKFRVVGVNDDEVEIGVVSAERQYDATTGLEYSTVRISADELDDALHAARKQGRKARGSIEARTGSPTPLVDPRSTLADSSPVADERPPIRRSSEPHADPPIGSVLATGGRNEAEEQARIIAEAEVKAQDVINRRAGNQPIPNEVATADTAEVGEDGDPQPTATDTLPTEAQLKGRNRASLDRYAKAHGVDDPGSFANKAELAAAIVAARD